MASHHESTGHGKIPDPHFGFVTATIRNRMVILTPKEIEDHGDKLVPDLYRGVYSAHQMKFLDALNMASEHPDMRVVIRDAKNSGVHLHVKPDSTVEKLTRHWERKLASKADDHAARHKKSADVGFSL